MAALDRASRTRFVESMFATLAGRRPEILRTLGEQPFRAALEGGIGAAAEFGIDLESDVIEFVDLWLRADQDLVGRWSWAEPILRNTELSPDTRLELIQELLA